MIPDALRQSLIVGPSMVTALEWHDRIGSTNERVRELAATGAEEGHLVVADVQTAGRGRQGRTWHAPAGASLMWSLLLRPRLPDDRIGLLPLLTGLAVADAIQPFVPGALVSVKWPNDVLISAGGGYDGAGVPPGDTSPAAGGGHGAKVAGILVEGLGDTAVAVGVGTNTDWRGVERPPEVGARMTSVAEAAEAPVDRWRLLAAMMGVFGNRYDQWQVAPAAFLADYRERSATIGQRVRVMPVGRESFEADAIGIAATGALEVETSDGRTKALHAGEVEHLRPV